jgi:hypothetical protein
MLVEDNDWTYRKFTVLLFGRGAFSYFDLGKAVSVSREMG